MVVAAGAALRQQVLPGERCRVELVGERCRVRLRCKAARALPVRLVRLCRKGCPARHRFNLDLRLVRVVRKASCLGKFSFPEDEDCVTTCARMLSAQPDADGFAEDDILAQAQECLWQAMEVCMYAEVLAAFPADRSSRALYFLVLSGFISRSSAPTCPCGSTLRVERISSAAAPLPLRWRCCRSACGKRQSITTETLMSSAKLSPDILIRFLYCFSHMWPGVNTAHEVGVSEKTVAKWYLVFRLRLFSSALENVRVGGEDRTVQVR